MPGVLISHSSKDKEFVFRLAIDLLGAGFPVWLDAYEMEIGSQIRQRIHEGIDHSTHVILVISEASVASDWVREELELALEKEKEIEYPFILPVKLGECAIPLSIRGRLHVNFAQDYASALEQLENALRRRGAAAVQVPFEKQLVPIRLDHSVFVDEVILRNRLSLLRFTPESRFTADQFVMSPDPVYEALRAKLLRTLQSVEQNPAAPREERNYLKAAYSDLRHGERALQDGLASIVNFIAARNWNPHVITESVFWFVRLWRNRLLVNMWSAQKLDSPPTITLGPHIMKGLFHEHDQTREFYGVDELHEYAVFRLDAEEVTSVVTGPDRFIDDYLKEFASDLSFAMFLVDANLDTLYKFIIPQIFYYGYFSHGWSVEKSRLRNR